MIREKSQGVNRLLSVLMDLALAVCAACSLVLDMNLLSGNTYWNWWSSLPGTPAVTVMTCEMFYLLRQKRKHLPSLGGAGWLLSLFLGVWWVLARSVAATKDVNQPFLTNGQLLKAMVVALGTACIYELLLRLLLFALSRKDEACCTSACGLIGIYNRHTMLFSAAVTLLLWMPQLVTGYPGSFSADTVSQMWQWQGEEAFTSHHPPFGTILIGTCIDIGRMLGSATGGMYLYVLLQAVLGVAVIGYSQQIMAKLCTPLWLRACALLVCGIGLVYANNVTVFLKDIPYSYGMLLLMCELVRWIWLEKENTLRGSMLRIMLAVALMVLMRNNGKYVIVPLCAALFVLALRGQKGRAVLCAMMAVSLVIVLGAESWIMRAWNIEPGSRAEALSLPFQQTARFVRDHQGEIPREEIDVIDAVLPYEWIDDFYDPMISDPVKGAFREEATTEDLLAYLRVWFAQFLRDPLCYVKATFIQNALLFDPQTYNVILFRDLGIPSDLQQSLGVSKPEWTVGLIDMEYQLEMMALSMPVFAQMNSVGFHCILLLLSCLIAWKKRLPKMGIVLLPMVVSMMIIVAGPCIENQDRYGFPIIYCIPLVLACLSSQLHEKDEECKEVRS